MMILSSRQSGGPATATAGDDADLTRATGFVVSEDPAGPVSRPGLIPLLGSVLAVVYGTLRVSGPPGDMALVLGFAAFIPFSAGTAAAFAVASRRAASSAARRAFRAYAASFAATAIGTVLAVLGRTIGPKDAFDWWANVPYLLSYPLAVLAIVSFPNWRPRGAVRLRLGLEAAVAIVAGVTLTWFLVVRHLPVPSSLVDQVLQYAYPVGDLVIFATLVSLMVTIGRRKDMAIVRLIALSQFLYLLGDLAFQLLIGGANPIALVTSDVLYVLGYIGLLWGAEAALRRPGDVLPAGGMAGETGEVHNPLPLTLGLLMYALLLAVAWQSGSTAVRVLGLAAVTVSLMVLARDALTARHNLRLARELEAARNAARLRGVVSYLRTGVAVLDRRGRVVVTNGAARRLLGLEDGSDPAGWSDVVDETGAPARSPLDLARTAATEGRAIRGALLGVTRTAGSPRAWILLDAEPLGDGSAPVEEVVCTLSDVSERRQLDERLRQAQRLEAVGQLAGGVAHDFNNLLTAITGYGGLLQKRLKAGTADRQDVDEILHAAGRATSLTQQLLAYGRRQRLRPEVVDLNGVVVDNARLLQQLVGSGVELRLELADGLPRLLVDRGQVEQVIVNLAVNARDAMPGGGTLTISTRRRDAHDGPAGPDPGSRDRHGVLLEVRDTGTGMTDEVRARAFEPFFTTKPVGKGTGLGLSTVYGIVTQSGGDAWIESEPGRGTTVAVLLPAPGSNGNGSKHT